MLLQAAVILFARRAICGDTISHKFERACASFVSVHPCKMEGEGMTEAPHAALASALQTELPDGPKCRSCLQIFGHPDKYLPECQRIALAWGKHARNKARPLD